MRAGEGAGGGRAAAEPVFEPGGGVAEEATGMDGDRVVVGQLVAGVQDDPRGRRAAVRQSGLGPTHNVFGSENVSTVVYREGSVVAARLGPLRPRPGTDRPRRPW